MPNNQKREANCEPKKRLIDYFMQLNQRFPKWRRILIGIALALMTCWVVVFAVLRFYVIPRVGQYKTQIEVVASQALKKNVSIEKLYGDWNFLSPQIVVEGLHVAQSTKEEKLKLNRVVATLSWWSILKFKPYLSTLEIFSPDLTIKRDKNGQIYVAGILIENKETKDFTALNWVFSQGAIVIEDAQLHWIDDTRNTTLDINHVNATLENGFYSHDFSILGIPNRDIMQKIDISGSFSHPFFVQNVGDFAHWTGDVIAHIDDANLVTWSTLIALPIDIKQGYLSADVSAQITNKVLDKISAQVGARQIIIDWNGRARPLVLDEAKANVIIQGLFSKQKKDWSLDVKHAYLRSATGPNLNNMDVFVAVHQENEQLQGLTLELAHVNLSALKDALLYVPVGDAIKKQAQFMTVNGEIVKAQVDWKKTGAYQVQVDFDDMSICNSHYLSEQEQKELLFAWPNQLGFEHISGQIKASQTNGELSLRSKNGVLHLPLYSEQAPMRADELLARVQWQIKDGILNAQLQDVSFSRFGMTLTGHGQYTKNLTDANDIGAIDIALNIDRLQVTDVKHFIPIQTPKSLAQWLSKSLQGGYVKDATVVLKGKLSEFPFEKQGSTGVFTVNAPLEDAILNFAPESFSVDKKRPLWPVLEKINGAFMMKANSILIHADNAQTHGAQLQDVDVVIADVMNDATLEISGQAIGQMQQFIGYVNNSPVVEWISRFTENIQTTGETKLDLKIRLPLEHMNDVVVKGELQFLENDVTLFDDLPTIERVTGLLTFTEKGFYLDKFNGQFLHEAVAIDGGTQSNGTFLVKGHGLLSAKGLQKTYSSGVMKSLVGLTSGSTPFDVLISNGQVKVESSLAGFRINLPYPLGKSDEVKKLTVILKDKPSRQKVSFDELTANYGNAVSTRYLRRRIGRGDWTVYRGGVGILTQPVLQENLLLRVNAQKVNLNEWVKKITELFFSTKSKGTARSSKLLQYLNPYHYFIQAKELNAMDALLTNVKLSGTQHNGKWDLNVISDQINGNILWLDATADKDNRIIARLKSFVIEPKSFTNAAKTSGKSDIMRIPTLDVVTEKMSIFGIDLGKTEITAHNVENRESREWVIDKLKVTNPDAQLLATGSWRVIGLQHETSLNYQMDIKNAGKLLSRFGQKGLLKNGQGTIRGEVNWKNLPFKFDIASMIGNLEMKIASGQFLKVEPGAAKLLGVLSMQSITNRLSLDFRDIFSKGFAFDEITVNANLLNGQLKTENFKMNGITAAVLMNGNVNLVEETQNLHVVVVPQVDAGMASIAYGFINPAIGVGTFLAQMVIKQPIMKELASEYQITGNWKNPQFKEIKVGQKKGYKKTKEQHSEN